MFCYFYFMRKKTTVKIKKYLFKVPTRINFYQKKYLSQNFFLITFSKKLPL